jgi:hypothetical protein
MSSLSLVPTTGRTQTAYCIGPAIRCMMNGHQGRSDRGIDRRLAREVDFTLVMPWSSAKYETGTLVVRHQDP